jgi:hypothetical protein
MDYRKTFSKKTLDVMNFDRKYGSNWIKFDNETYSNSNKGLKLYATGDYTWSSGRIFIALPADKKITASEKVKYNIIE